MTPYVNITGDSFFFIFFIFFILKGLLNRPIKNIYKNSDMVNYKAA